MPEATPAIQASASTYFTVESQDAIPAPVLRALFGYWDGLRDSRPMPAFSDLDPLDIPRPALPHVFLIDVLAPKRFAVRLQGTAVVRQAGVDLTGCLIHEIQGAEGTQARFERLIVERRPYYCKVPLTWSEHNFKVYETVVCPLSDRSGRAIRRLFTGVVFS